MSGKANRWWRMGVKSMRMRARRSALRMTRRRWLTPGVKSPVGRGELGVCNITGGGPDVSPIVH